MKYTPKKRNKIIFLLIGIFVVVIIFLIYLNSLKPLAAKQYDVSFEVSNEIGFDLNSSALSFGKTIPGSTAYREINVENKYDFPLKIDIVASKNTPDLLYIDKELVIEPGQTLSFPVYIDIPINYSLGNYTGSVMINFRKYTR